MNRRTALLLSMFLGGLATRGLRAQSPAPAGRKQSRPGARAGAAEARRSGRAYPRTATSLPASRKSAALR